MQTTKPILFVDFDGTICHDRYWRSLTVAKHNELQRLLFENDTTLVNDWMYGKYTAEEVNQIAAEKIGMSFKNLWVLFVNDCSTMVVPQKVLEIFSELRDRYTVMLITGNMDSFSRFTVPALNLERYFDHISNSYYEGKHKTDNGGEIFIEYAGKYGVTLKECAVFDDSKDACALFEELGGNVHHVTREYDITHYLNLYQTN